MNRKNISTHLRTKLNDWVNSVKEKNIKQIIEQNAIVTGGAIVSLLSGEEPHDYDIYFKTKESCLAVANYYADLWNKTQKDKSRVSIEDKDGRISCYISEKPGIVEDKEEQREPYAEDTKNKKKPKYRAKMFSTNAVSLSDKIQLVIRFYGCVEEIHKNYDFVHCTCSYDYATNTVNLPSNALEAIINKELSYIGSKYPLCSIIRTRKFISRGYHINAGQYLKMAYQLNKLNLMDPEVLKDQLAGVDSLYFGEVIEALESFARDNPDSPVEETVFFEVVNKIFGGA